MGKAGGAELGMVSPPATPGGEAPDGLTSVPTSVPTSAQHLQGPGLRVGIALARAHPGLSGIHRDKPRVPREKGMEKQRDLHPKHPDPAGSGERDPHPRFHRIVPELALPELCHEQGAPWEAGIRHSGCTGTSSQPGSAIRGCRQGVTPGSPPHPGVSLPVPPAPTAGDRGRPVTALGAGPSLFLGCPPSWVGGSPSRPSPKSPKSRRKTPGRGGWGKEAVTIAAVIAIGGGEWGCFPLAVGPERFGSPGKES